MTVHSAPAGRLRPTARAAALAMAVPALLLLAACGPSGATAATTRTPAARPSATPPGVVGLAAAVNGSSIEVQNPTSGQVTVTVSGGTRIQQRRTITRAAVAVGDCLVATGSPLAGGSGLTAVEVTVSAPRGGSCVTARGGGGSSGFGGPRNRPSASARPSPNPDRGAMATGSVTGVSATAITVTGVLRSGGPRPSTPPSARALTIATDGATRYTELAAVTAGAIKVGECVAATGPSNDIGTVAATSISLFAPGPNGCTGLAGRFAGSPRPGGGNG